jgi:hypothetical protein
MSNSSWVGPELVREVGRELEDDGREAGFYKNTFNNTELPAMFCQTLVNPALSQMFCKTQV